jgi:predicted cobalt transporter CbtA
LLYLRLGAYSVAAVLLLAPQVIGAPKPPEAESSVPAELATTFAASALTASAAFWLILGPLYGWLFARFADIREIRGAHA